MIEFAFQPGEIRLQYGQSVNLELINNGAILHTLVIPAAGIQVTLEQGERRTIGLGRLEVGTYEFYCSIPGHRDAGMTGRLVVGAGN